MPQIRDIHMDKSLPSSSQKIDVDFFYLASLIANTRSSFQNNVEKLSSAYDSLLLEFPLCYGYWTRYAYDMARLCDYKKAVIVYENAVKVATYSVDLWTNYCCFAMQSYKDPDDIRRLYERALSFVGKDYLSCLLWDKYIEFELANKELVKLSHIYLRTLGFPSKKLHHYYACFKKLVFILEEELKLQNKEFSEDGFNEMLESEMPRDENMTGISHIFVNEPNAFFKPHIFKKYLLTGESLYTKSCMLDKKIACYESAISRTYFHVQLLDESQLENWHCYLDFVEMDGDLDWTVKLYERCLIPCANYQEFWIRYAEHMEANGGREIAKSAIKRALKLFLKGDAFFHLYYARFMERIGENIDARSSLSSWEYASMPDFLHNVIRSANMEKRLGNVGEAFQVYEKAIIIAEQKHDLHTLSMLYAHFAKFKFVVTASTSAAKDIFLRGIMKIPQNKYLIEALIQFFILHDGTIEINAIDSIVSHALSSNADVSCALSIDDRMSISCLFIEFVDLYGTIHDVEKAWSRHRKLFPDLVRPAACSLQQMEFCQEKEIVREVTTSLSNLCNLDSFRSTGENRPANFGGIKGNTDVNEHASAPIKNERVLSDGVEKLNMETVGWSVESDCTTAGENTAPIVVDDTSEVSKITEFKHQVLSSPAHDINPLASESAVVVHKKPMITNFVGDVDSCDKIQSSPKPSQTLCLPNMPSQAGSPSISNPLCVESNTRLTPDCKGMLEQVEMKECGQLQQIISNESTSCHNVDTKMDSLSIVTDDENPIAVTHAPESLQFSRIQDHVSLQVLDPQEPKTREHAEQADQTKLQHREEQSYMEKHQLPHGYLQHASISAAYPCAVQTTYQVPQTACAQGNDGNIGNQYHQHQQLWYYYPQQMYYAQLQQQNLQLHMQYMQNEQTVQIQRSHPHLQIMDGQEQSHQLPNPQQSVQPQYLMQQMQQNHQYQMCNQSSNQHFGYQHQPSQQQQLLQPQQQFPIHQPQAPYYLSFEQMQQDARIYQQQYQNQFTSSGNHLQGINHLQTSTYGNNSQVVNQQATASEAVQGSAKTSEELL